MELFKTAVILAGGKSSRMGFDKQFLKINEKRLIDTLVYKLKKEFDEIIVVTNKLENYTGVSYKVVSDELKDKGPLGGIHIGLKESSSQYVYFIACDMPNVNVNYIRGIKERIRMLDVDACVIKTKEQIQTFNAFYSKNIIKTIETHILEDKRSLHYLLEKINTIYLDEKFMIEYSHEADMFLNLNTKEDLKKYNKNY